MEALRPLQQRILCMFPEAQGLFEAELQQLLRLRAEREGASGVVPLTTQADQKQLVRRRSLQLAGEARTQKR